MKIALFYHSLLSDWNHGNAHFLRGIATELISRGHDVRIYEPADAWSMNNLLRDHGWKAIRDFNRYYPALHSVRYNPQQVSLEEILHDTGLVIVHEWNEPSLVKRIGDLKRNFGFRLLFHDTHHRAATNPEAMVQYELKEYDGVLAFGDVIREIYLSRKWTAHAWTWHEAADTRVFKPVQPAGEAGHLVWIGNWGDGERTKELEEFLVHPAGQLGIRACIHGVRYPPEAMAALGEAGIQYGGWVPNYLVPRVFSGYRFTVHIPRRPYVEALPGIPTIRPFEAMACGIPLISAWWEDRENLFTPGKDFVVVRNGEEMANAMRRLMADEEYAGELSAHALKTIHDRHTCAHRVDELYGICSEIGLSMKIKTPTE